MCRWNDILLPNLNPAVLLGIIKNVLLDLVCSSIEAGYQFLVNPRQIVIACATVDSRLRNS